MFMREIRISLNETLFTKLCKEGHLQYNSTYGRSYAYFTKNDMLQLSTGQVVQKEVEDVLLKIALQDIGIQLVKEIVRRSPLYSDIVELINLD